MLYETTSYSNGYRQIYAVGARRSKNDSLEIIAEFRDVAAPGYSAEKEADMLCERFTDFVPLGDS